MRKLFRLIPRPMRRGATGVVAALFAQAVLGLAGLAVLLPLLLFILRTDALAEGSLLGRLYTAGGFTDPRLFLATLCGSILGLLVLKSLAMLGLQGIVRRYMARLYRYFSRRLFHCYRNRGLPFLRQSHSSTLVRNVNYLTYNLVMNVYTPLATLLSEGTLLLLVFAALIAYNATISVLLVAVFLPVVGAYMVTVRRRLLRYGEEENEAMRRQARTVADTLRGLPDIEVAGAFPAMAVRFDASLERVAELKNRTDRMAAMPQITTELSVAVALVGLVLYHLYAGGRSTGMLFGIFAVASLRVLPSVRTCLNMWWKIRYNRYAADVVAEGCGSDGEPQPETDARLHIGRGIAIDRLDFRYPDGGTDDWVIRDLTLRIAPGERIGVQGASGAGKSTLLALLLGFYAPTRGTISIDGTPLTPRNGPAWRRSVGYVPQQVFIEDDSLAANIALGVPPQRIDRHRLDDAIRWARLDDLIATLPEGVDTPIGEGGSRLSGGQRQRVGIARALYKEAEVLLLDEATSALDHLTEEEIHRALASLARTHPELTLIIVAHNDRSLALCERIIHIE